MVTTQHKTFIAENFCGSVANCEFHHKIFAVACDEPISRHLMVMVIIRHENFADARKSTKSAKVSVMKASCYMILHASTCKPATLVGLSVDLLSASQGDAYRPLLDN